MDRNAPPPLDVAVARRVAEREMRELLDEGAALSLTRFNGGYVVVGTFTSPRPPGDAALVVFDDEVVEVYPSWPVAMVAEHAERDFARRLGTASDVSHVPDVSNADWGMAVDHASARWAARVEREGLPGTTYDLAFVPVSTSHSADLHALLGAQVELRGSAGAVKALADEVVHRAEHAGWEVRAVTGGWESHDWPQGAVRLDARTVYGWIGMLGVDALARVFAACVDWADEYWSTVSVAVCRALAVRAHADDAAVNFVGAAALAYQLVSSETWTSDERAVLDSTAEALLEVHQALGSSRARAGESCGVMVGEYQLRVARDSQHARVGRVLATTFVEATLTVTTPTLLVVDTAIGRHSDKNLGSDHVGPSVARLRIRA